MLLTSLKLNDSLLFEKNIYLTGLLNLKVLFKVHKIGYQNKYLKLKSKFVQITNKEHSLGTNET